MIRILLGAVRQRLDLAVIHAGELQRGAELVRGIGSVHHLADKTADRINDLAGNTGGDAGDGTPTGAESLAETLALFRSVVLRVADAFRTRLDTLVRLLDGGRAGLVLRRIDLGIKLDATDIRHNRLLHHPRLKRLFISLSKRLSAFLPATAAFTDCRMSIHDFTRCTSMTFRPA